MSDPQDASVHHRHFAVQCFNAVWPLLDLAQRDETQVEEMIHLAHASLWHWRQSPDCTPLNESVGLWQLARVYAVADQAAQARHYASLCERVGAKAELPAFYVGYSHEAAARAETALGDYEAAREHLSSAASCAAAVEEDDDRAVLEADLDELRAGLAEAAPGGGEGGGEMRKVKLVEKLREFDTLWDPKVVAELNGQEVKLAKVKGQFDWHHHADEDELFLVLHGRLRIELREGVEVLEEGELMVVPRGVEHRPVAETEAHILLFEPATTLNTGNLRNERTVASPQRL
jgi:mannose-6-phosphate isomerase-like protein (cupin superfamily)